MGWKHETQGRVQSVTDSLSENQCGMETEVMSDLGAFSYGVERDQCGMETLDGD